MDNPNQIPFTFKPRTARPGRHGDGSGAATAVAGTVGGKRKGTQQAQSQQQQQQQQSKQKKVKIDHKKVPLIPEVPFCRKFLAYGRCPHTSVRTPTRSMSICCRAFVSLIDVLTISCECLQCPYPHMRVDDVFAAARAENIPLPVAFYKATHRTVPSSAAYFVPQQQPQQQQQQQSLSQPLPHRQLPPLPLPQSPASRPMAAPAMPAVFLKPSRGAGAKFSDLDALDDDTAIDFSSLVPRRAGTGLGRWQQQQQQQQQQQHYAHEYAMDGEDDMLHEHDNDAAADNDGWASNADDNVDSEMEQ